MPNLRFIQQFISIGGCILVCAGPIDFSERFYFANPVIEIAINFWPFSTLINKEHQKKRRGKAEQLIHVLIFFSFVVDF